MGRVDEIIKGSPQDIEVFDSLVKTATKIRNYDNILCAISGGSDSDILLDMFSMLDFEKKVHYVFFDTGLEYAATKEHIKLLQQKYGVEIKTEKAVKPIPLCCRTYGQPFISKQVSEFISRLQRYCFKWEDKPLEELLLEYPKCRAALRWWCNDFGEKSSFNIERNKYLKEFMIENPPTFRISNKCCTYAKKKVAQRYIKQNEIDLNVTGVRKAEGGTRATAYKSCFTVKSEGADEYRPIFWYKQENKEVYERHYGVTHSRCYRDYGLKRTGCAGCPFGRDFENELKIIKKHEPKLYKAVNNIFGDSYRYTRKYRAYRNATERKLRNERI